MVRAARARPDREGIGRLVVALLLALIVFASESLVLPGSAAAGDGRSVATIRHRQLAAERTMRRNDRKAQRIERRRTAHQRRVERADRRLDRAIARRDRAERKLEDLRDQLAEARLVRDRTLRVRPSPSGRQLADLPSLRRRVARLDRLERARERAVVRADRRVDHVREAKQRLVRQAPGGRVSGPWARRERAEDRLAGQIGLMLDLAKERAQQRFGRSDERRFRRPAKGQVSQGYGCQRTRGKRGRGRCVAFHDGIDIATRRGAPVRAAAAGYVAYVGWNPWDAGRRAFVVIIGHARGFETIYGHLQPVRRVRAGQRVRRGQVIGVVGLTGRTSGAHVHWEVSRGFRTVDPRRAGR